MRMLHNHLDRHAPNLSGKLDRVSINLPVLDRLSAFGLAIEGDDLDLVGLAGLFERGPGPQGGRIVGCLTVVVFRVPSGSRAWIEDVVVDGAYRNRGIGEALSRAALRHAADAGARTVDLTSRSSREAANRLYQRLGFARRETNLYRHTLSL